VQSYMLALPIRKFLGRKSHRRDAGPEKKSKTLEDFKRVKT